MARLGAARIVAAHVQQLSPGNVAIRNEHVEWVRSVCDGRDYVLAVGDFNSTANHLDGGRIGRCADHWPILVEVPPAETP